MTHSVRTFRARTMPEALRRVKQELGNDAVILGTRQVAPSGLGNLTGSSQVEITAAPPDTVTTAPRLRGRPTPAARVTGGAKDAQSLVTPSPEASSPRNPSHRDELTRMYYVELVKREVAEDLARAISAEAADLVRRGRPQQEALRLAVQRRLESLVIGDQPATAASGPRSVALVGPPGVGKTTTIAKLAAHTKLRERRDVALVTLDLHHLAKNEPLRRYAEIIDVPIYSPTSIAEASELPREAQRHDVLYIDTCGVGVRDRSRLVRLAAMLRSCRPTETHLVLPASMTSTAQARVHDAFNPLKPTRLILTKLDETIGLGAILNAVEMLHLGVSYTADGQNVPFDLNPACPTQIAHLVLS